MKKVELLSLEQDTPEITLKELMEMDPAIEKAAKIIGNLINDEETMNTYWERERFLHERANMINSAKQKGRKEGEINKVKVAIKNMLEKHMGKELIVGILEVDISLVEEVEKEINNR